MSEPKTKGEELQEALCYQRKNLTETMTKEELEQAFDFCEGYKDFLNAAKTEREVVSRAVELLEAEGFVPFDPETTYAPGDRVYWNNRGKALLIATIGKKSLAQGAHINAAHIDSPRLDLKPNPLYEQGQLALMKTHYYGGIKKYQWATVPMSLHGVIVKKNGETVQVRIGDEPGDPVFCVTDLLIHLAGDQMQRTLAKGIQGEELNLLCGSISLEDSKVPERVKLNILNLLHEKYGIIEEDFLSAELEAVPAYDMRDLGFDRSMIGGYGQDDRVCAYPALMAALDCKDPETTLITVLADKEEIGSEGNTGLNSDMLRYFAADLAKPYGIDGRRVLMNSQCLSSDVNGAFDPTFADAFEKNNTCYLNYGVCLTKYTGSRGKGGSNDASAEFIGKVRKILDENKVGWQTGELGKVDQGGGGTVAMMIANLGVDVVDLGVPVLSMHSPFEVTAKVDVYMAYKAFNAYANQK